MAPAARVRKAPAVVAVAAPERQAMLVGQFFKTKLCRFHESDRCRYGSTCPFAHSSSELEASPDLSKTSICRNWQTGKCNLSSFQCPFAHGKEELRRTPLYDAKSTPPGSVKASDEEPNTPSSRPPQKPSSYRSGPSWADYEDTERGVQTPRKPHAEEVLYQEFVQPQMVTRTSSEPSILQNHRLDEEHSRMPHEKGLLSSPNVMWPIATTWTTEQQVEAGAPGAIWHGDSFTSTKVMPRAADGQKNPRKRTSKKKLMSTEMPVDQMQVDAGHGTYYALQQIAWPIYQADEARLVWDPIGEQDISADALTSAQCSGMFLQSRPGMEAAAMYNGGILLFSAPVIPWVPQTTHTFASSSADIEHALKQAQPDFYED